LGSDENSKRNKYSNALLWSSVRMLEYIIIICVLFLVIYYIIHKREQQKWNNFITQLKDKGDGYPKID
jgi:uncharacterized BrkB/YihY/UPF0761 family membrane protein